MRNDNFIDFGEEISKTVRKVLNSQEIYDLKHTIYKTMDSAGLGSSPNFQEPLRKEGFPYLSKEYRDVNKKYEPFKGSSKKNTRIGSTIASTLILVFGFIGAIASGLTALIVMIVEASIGKIPALTAVTSVFAVLFFVFLILIYIGFKIRNRTKRFQRYLKVLNGRTYCTIQDFSKATGRDPKFIVKDLQKLIKAGFFTEAYMDEQKTCLITDYKTYVQYLETMEIAKERQAAEQREKEKWANREDGIKIKETIDEGKRYIKIIREANDDLPEVEISEKLDQLEVVTTKIFDYVEQHPDKLSEIRKFMCYYMPITLKLVKAYQNFDEHGTDQEDIVTTKIEIKNTLDTINKAYQNLLKKLMQADILDVSSDISALETILAQEGLTENNF